ncbi:MAG: hypothetical protein WKG07_41070 [Hymenobacter sp.]
MEQNNRASCNGGRGRAPHPTLRHETAPTRRLAPGPGPGPGRPRPANAGPTPRHAVGHGRREPGASSPPTRSTFSSTTPRRSTRCRCATG